MGSPAGERGSSPSRGGTASGAFETAPPNPAADPATRPPGVEGVSGVFAGDGVSGGFEGGVEAGLPLEGGVAARTSPEAIESGAVEGGGASAAREAETSVDARSHANANAAKAIAASRLHAEAGRIDVKARLIRASRRSGSAILA